MDTLAILDGEMGLNLPAPMSECPSIFFDALGIVRSMKAKVAREEKKG